MAKPVGIGARSFRTQSSALEHFKALLHRYQDGQRIADQGDHADLVALIARYDPVLDAVGEPTKGAGQIAHFERRLNTGTGWSSSGFWVVRQDGSATDFSYIDAVKGNTVALKPASKRPKRVRAPVWCPQVMAELKRLRQITANLGKEKVFAKLVPFCQQHGLALPSVSTIGHMIASAPDSYAPARGTQLLLQLLYRRGQRRLGQVQPLGCGTAAAQFLDANQGAECLELHGNAG